MRIQKILGVTAPKVQIPNKSGIVLRALLPCVHPFPSGTGQGIL